MGELIIVTLVSIVDAGHATARGWAIREKLNLDGTVTSGLADILWEGAKKKPTVVCLRAGSSRCHMARWSLLVFVSAVLYNAKKPNNFHVLSGVQTIVDLQDFMACQGQFESYYFDQADFNFRCCVSTHQFCLSMVCIKMLPPLD